jgi:hypothetical protein
MAQTKRGSSSGRRPRTTARPRRTTSKSTRRTKRSTGKVFNFSRWSQRNTLITLGVVLGLIILFALLQRGGVPISGGGTGTKEISSSAVYGTIVDAYPRVPPKGVIKLRSRNTGKVYTFYTGLKTRYSPVDRGPAIGDTAKISYINDRGYLKATYVRLY